MCAPCVSPRVPPAMNKHLDYSKIHNKKFFFLRVVNVSKYNELCFICYMVSLIDVRNMLPKAYKAKQSTFSNDITLMLI